MLFLRVSSVDSVISIELIIDWTNVSLGLMLLRLTLKMTSVLKCDKVCFLISSYYHDLIYICLNALKAGLWTADFSTIGC